MKTERDLTEGSVLESVVAFSLPYLLSYFLQTLYGMADLFIIGQFETAISTTAVSIGSQIMHMITLMIVGLAMGSTVSIGQAIGRKDKSAEAKYIGNTITLFLTLSIAITAIFLLFRNILIRAVSTPAEAIEETKNYLTICFIGIPMITIYNITSSIYRGMGDSKRPMLFIALSCAINIALDYLLIGAFRLGAAGAALGTTLSQSVSAIVSSIALMRQKRDTKLNKSDFKLSKNEVMRILRIGIPVSLQDGFIQISFITITIIANRRGLIDAAAVGIVEKIMGFMFLVPSAMNGAVAALASQSIGAGKNDRAIKILIYALLIAIVLGTIIVGAVMFTAEPLVALFTNDPIVSKAGGEYLKGYIGDSFFGGIQFSFSGFFCAIGHSEISFLHNALSILIVRIPGALLASHYYPSTLFPMGLASTFGSLFSSLICIVAFILLKKKLK